MFWIIPGRVSPELDTQHTTHTSHSTSACLTILGSGVHRESIYRLGVSRYVSLTNTRAFVSIVSAFEWYIWSEIRWRYARIHQGTRAPGVAGDLGPGPLLFEKS